MSITTPLKPMLNEAAPDFFLPSTQDTNIQLSNLKGKNVILYFYPKDCTPGCTQQGQDFRDHYTEFQKYNTIIFGLSRDTLKLHLKFKVEQQFPFELLSDADERVCRLYDVIRPKTMYGKTVQAIERSTFLIDSNGILRYEWRKVNVAGHVLEVLEAAKTLLKLKI